MRPLSYAGYRFPPEIIQHAIWLYLRFTLSFRDVEELLTERGIEALSLEDRRLPVLFADRAAAIVHVEMLQAQLCVAATMALY